jgi:hypothetical protein
MALFCGDCLAYTNNQTLDPDSPPEVWGWCSTYNKEVSLGDGCHKIQPREYPPKVNYTPQNYETARTVLDDINLIVNKFLTEHRAEELTVEQIRSKVVAVIEVQQRGETVV